MQIKNTLIISTYNWVEALNLVLKSVLKQKKLPDEVIIADDGSGKDTKDSIERYKSKFTIPLIHVWHEDEGFKKAKILNKAIAKAKGEYIIQVDGDCILHPCFVKDHLSFAEKGTYLYGARVAIQQKQLSSLFENEQVTFNMFSTGIKKRTRALYFPLLSYLYASKSHFSKKYRGCNTSFFKSDFIKINGYNEVFTGWGREDSELALRFHNLGLKGRRLRYKAIVYHIYHNEKSRDNLDRNNSVQEKTIQEKIKRANNGVDKYLD